VRSEPGSNSQVENSIIDYCHVILNRRELTSISTSISAREIGVVSLKRDRQSLFTRTQISPGPASFAAHVSLSSHIQLSKNRPLNAVK
ncbi:hypothetical protein, partial [Agrobacterium fabrum]|uniref:hypothetical protein n=1 Tax=Agrobacterium fabrum TaxID=1176649 RepID=UPI001AEEE309